MYLNRKIDNTLVEWKIDPRHKPLLMRGARQVGKTTAVRRLAESFETFVEINLETDDEVRKYIERSFDIQGLIALIEVRYGKRIIPGKTLLFLAYAQTQSYLAARNEQRDIMQNLKEDFAKYKTRVDPAVLRTTLRSVIEQTGRQFTYSNSETPAADRGQVRHKGFDEEPAHPHEREVVQARRPHLGGESRRT